MSDIVEKINKENAEKYGEMQECCGLFEHYCRCKDAYLTVLDFSTGVVNIYKCQYPQYPEDLENFIESKGHSVNNCQWMITKELNLIEHF